MVVMKDEERYKTIVNEFIQKNTKYIKQLRN